MPKVTVYLKNPVIDEIKGLVEDDIQAGAHPEEVSFSSKTSMLLELGLRVYKIRQSEQVVSGRDDFDRVMMDAALEAKYLTQNLMRIIGEKNGINLPDLKSRVKRSIRHDMEPFFPEVNDETGGKESVKRD